MAKSLGIPFGTYRGWNAYKRLPDVSAGHHIAQALGVTVEYLVSGNNPDTTAQKQVVKDRCLSLLAEIEKL